MVHGELAQIASWPVKVSSSCKSRIDNSVNIVSDGRESRNRTKVARSHWRQVRAKKANFRAHVDTKTRGEG